MAPTASSSGNEPKSSSTKEATRFVDGATQTESMARKKKSGMRTYCRKDNEGRVAVVMWREEEMVKVEAARLVECVEGARAVIVSMSISSVMGSMSSGMRLGAYGRGRWGPSMGRISLAMNLRARCRLKISVPTRMYKMVVAKMANLRKALIFLAIRASWLEKRVI